MEIFRNVLPNNESSVQFSIKSSFLGQTHLYWHTISVKYCQTPSNHQQSNISVNSVASSGTTTTITLYHSLSPQQTISSLKAGMKLIISASLMQKLPPLTSGQIKSKELVPGMSVNYKLQCNFYDSAFKGLWSSQNFPGPYNLHCYHITNLLPFPFLRPRLSSPPC